MVDTLDDVEPPYRSGDSAKVDRNVAWPNVEDAKRRVENEINLPANVDEQLARDLIVLMRELGRVTVENAEMDRRGAVIERLETNVRHWREECGKLHARNAELVAALEKARPFVRIAVTRKQADASSRWYDKAFAALAQLDAALAEEPASGAKPARSPPPTQHNRSADEMERQLAAMTWVSSAEQFVEDFDHDALINAIARETYQEQTALGDENRRLRGFVEHMAEQHLSTETEGGNFQQAWDSVVHRARAIAFELKDESK